MRGPRILKQTLLSWHAGLALLVEMGSLEIEHEHSNTNTEFNSCNRNTFRMLEENANRKSTQQRDSKQLDNPTRAIWIPSHACWTTHLKIHDLTPYQLDLTHGEAENYRNARKAANFTNEQLDANPPLWTIEKQGLFKHMNVYEGDIEDSRNDQRIVCEWNQARWECGVSRFTFLESSPTLASVKAVHDASQQASRSYPTHNMTMQRITRVNLFERSESFVIDSQEYVWRWDNIWSPRQLTLYKTLSSGTSTPVARYHGQIPFCKAAGLLTVDEYEVNLFMAVVTCCAMVRKDLKRQN
jgi:hypothetical protein